MPLVANLDGKKEYVIYIRHLLIMTLCPLFKTNHGLVLKRGHRVIEFKNLG